MCGSPLPYLRRKIKMYWTASAKKVTNPFVSILITTVLISVCVFAQTATNAPQSNVGSKKTSSGKGKKQSGAKGEAKKTEAPPAAAEKAANPSDGDQEEAKGPWHGLTWRLIGPFRGGRVLAVSGVVGGDQHTYYFGATGGGVWKTTDGGLTWHPLTDKVKNMAPSIGAIAVAPSDLNVIYAG